MKIWTECTAQLQPNGDVLTVSRLCSDTNDHLNSAVHKMVHTSRLLEDAAVFKALMQWPAFSDLMRAEGWTPPAKGHG